MNWTDLNIGQIESGDKGDTDVFEALRDNAHAIYSNEYFSYDTADSPWTVPAGVYRIKILLIGAGGSGGDAGADYADGTDSECMGMVAGGGLGGGPGATDGNGGVATGGDVNIPGGDNIRDLGGGSIYHGAGRAIDIIAGFVNYSGWGNGCGGWGDGNNYGGGAGATCIGVFEVTPGDEIDFTIGTCGNGYTGDADSRGNEGSIYINW